MQAPRLEGDEALPSPVESKNDETLTASVAAIYDSVDTFVVCCICGTKVPVKVGTGGNWGRTVAMSDQDVLTVNMIRATMGKLSFEVDLQITTRRCINCCAPTKEAFKRIKEQIKSRCLNAPVLDTPREIKHRGKPALDKHLIGERLKDPDVWRSVRSRSAVKLSINGLVCLGLMVRYPLISCIFVQGDVMCRGDIHRFNKKTFGELTQNFLDVEKRISLRELHVPGIHFDTSRPQEHAKRFSRGNGGSGGGSGGGGGVIVVPGHPAYAPYRNSPRYYHDEIEHPPKRTRRPLSPGQPDDVYDEDCYHHHPPPPYTVVVHELVGTYPPYYADNVCARRAQYPLGTHPAWYEQPPLPPPPPPAWWGPYSIEAFYRRPPGIPPCQDARNISETVGNVERTASPPCQPVQCAEEITDAAAEHAINETSPGHEVAANDRISPPPQTVPSPAPAADPRSFVI